MAAVTTAHRRSVYSSPVGDLLLTGEDRVVTGVYFADVARKLDPTAGLERDDLAFAVVARQLDEYFAGERTTFDVDLRPRGTSFQLRVWEALRSIPYGETCSYAHIARRVGAGRGYRAVGLANGRNPISIIVPCHRVIGADGSLTGYGGGVERKRFLLELESGTLPFS